MSHSVSYPPARSLDLHRQIEPANLIELLRWRAVHQPNQQAYTFLPEGSAREQSLSYSDLDWRARSIATLLQSYDAAGKRVLLLYPAGLEYISAFFGCLYAGAVAVPLYPPRPNLTLQKLEAVTLDAQAEIALTVGPVVARMEPVVAKSPSLRSLEWLATDQLDDQLAGQWREPAIDSETLAFLQYTSGSTSHPKGVMVSHGNLLHNERIIQRAFQQTPESVIVGWLPLYHDMGLIGTVLQPLYVGAPAILMSPVSFLKSPVRWLQAISRFKGTTSGGPNFAYDLCVRKVTSEQLPTLDLSSWSVAFNGAEPIRRETLESFAATFAPCGFRPQAFFPCYGLAEATLFVSGRRKGASSLATGFSRQGLEQNCAVAISDEAGLGKDRGSIDLVSSGQSSPDQKIVIASPVSLTECAPGEVGEIWIAGPSVTRGYWNRPEDTRRAFKARLANTGEGPFLRSGDLGFMHNGELFITGRLKDLIIIRGVNHYPQDIEQTVYGSHPSLRAGCGAAFSIEADGVERLVIVQEVEEKQKPDLKLVIENICAMVAEEHEAPVFAVQLIRPHTILKTSSGKIRRQACRATFLENRFQVLAEWREAALSESPAINTAPLSSECDSKSVGAWLIDLLAAKLKIESRNIDLTQPLSRYGVDSLAAVELTHEIETALNVSLPLVDLLQSQSIAELAQQVRLSLENSARDHLNEIRASGDPGTPQPLSAGQQALWFIHQLAPDSPAYNIASAVRVSAGLNCLTLHQALQALVDRHAILRTTFSALNGKPMQHVESDMPVCFKVEDASTLSESSLHELLVQQSRAPFDLEHGPLLRVTVFQRAAGEHLVLLVVHHIIADFWSLSIMVHELGRLYEAAAEGKSAGLIPLRLQYADYVNRQQDQLSGAAGKALRTYWENHLAGVLPTLDLPTNHPRPPLPTFRGASQSFQLSKELAERLKELGQSHGATLFMTLLAAFQVLLHRYTGQKDFLVGSPTAGRPQADLAPLVGYFVNPIVMRANLEGNPTFAQYLRQVRREVLDAFKHQDYPFPLLVEQLHPDRDLSRSPLFQVMFAWQQTPAFHQANLAPFALGESGATAKLGPLSVESLALEQRVAQFDLFLMMTESEDGLHASLQYSTDLFEASTIFHLVAHFTTLLEGIAADPQGRISALPLLTEADRRLLLHDWNETAAPTAGKRCIHEQFESQVEQTPDRIAVVDDEAYLTYGELNRRANQLAHQLRRLGVGQESMVGVMMKRSAGMIVGLLGILKAGGAYVPLDPAYPAERLNFIVEDAQVRVLLAEQNQELLRRSTAHLIDLDADWKLIAQEPDENLSTGVTAANLAYVIYTSGSTGRPKGVAIAHQSATAFLDWSRTVFAPGELEGTLASTSICFDLSVFEIFSTLSSGGKIVMADNALQLPRLKAADAVSLVNTVPSAMTELVRTKGIPSSVRVVNLAGEALSNQLVQSLYELPQIRSVYNLYGPSEDTTYSTYTLTERGSAQEPTIGRPIANTQVYVLDQYFLPVPLGCTGELFIGGDGLARGYFGRPDLTAARFVPNPFNQQEGARLYRTGDLVRYRLDGQLEYLGRVDHQVKLRGFRIELGEIESVMRTYPNVTDLLVTMRDEADGDKRLVAYFVMSDGPSPEPGQLRNYLKKQLPDYMIPSAFVQLERLPLLPNGKVDRHSLPAPAKALRAETVEPRTPLEEILVGIAGGVLKVERVGLTDNFFDLGGHSLLATQFAARISESFGVELPLRTIFEQPTIEQLAAYIEAQLRDGASDSRAEIVAVPREGPLPLSPAQQRLWFIQQLEPESAAYNIAAAVRLSGRLNRRAFEQMLNEIVRRHEALRTRFISLDGEVAQQILPHLELSITAVDLTRIDDQSAERGAAQLMRAEAQRPFDLRKDALLRMKLIQLQESEHLAVLTMHHIISDGWSIGLLIEEMSELYQAFTTGNPSPLAELPVQYADYALWQRQLLAGETLESHLAYWREQLRDSPPLLKLPTDHPRPAVQSSRGEQQTFWLPRSLGEALNDLSRREGVTLFITLLAAFQTLLYRYSGQTDIILGTNVANRRSTRTEKLIGFFVNMLVLRSDLSGNPTFRELLRRVRQTTLDAYTHQDLPFEKLVRELQPERDLGRALLFQAVFSLENAGRQTLKFSGLTATAQEIDLKTAKYDLVLNMREGEQGLEGVLQYRTDLFESATISRLLKHFAQLLSSIVNAPETRLNALELLSAEENYLLKKATRVEELSFTFSL